MTIWSRKAPIAHEIAGVSKRPFDHSMVARSVIDPEFVWIEFVVDADAQEIVGDAGIEAHCGRRTQRRRWDGRDRSQIEVEVLDLGGPIAGHATFDAAAGRPAPLCVVAADDGVDRGAIAVEPQDRAGRHHLPDPPAPPNIRPGLRPDRDTRPRAQRCRPLDVLPLSRSVTLPT